MVFKYREGVVNLNENLKQQIIEMVSLIEEETELHFVLASCHAALRHSIEVNAQDLTPSPDLFQTVS